MPARGVCVQGQWSQTVIASKRTRNVVLEATYLTLKPGTVFGVRRTAFCGFSQLDRWTMTGQAGRCRRASEERDGAEPVDRAPAPLRPWPQLHRHAEDTTLMVLTGAPVLHLRALGTAARCRQPACTRVGASSPALRGCRKDRVQLPAGRHAYDRRPWPDRVRVPACRTPARCGAAGPSFRIRCRAPRGARPPCVPPTWHSLCRL
jgi:hypothetical protein